MTIFVKRHIIEQLILKGMTLEEVKSAAMELDDDIPVGFPIGSITEYHSGELEGYYEVAVGAEVRFKQMSNPAKLMSPHNKEMVILYKTNM